MSCQSCSQLLGLSPWQYLVAMQQCQADMSDAAMGVLKRACSDVMVVRL